MTTRKLFIDPENKSDIISNIRSLSGKDLISYANQIFPEWILADSPQFSSDLFKFNEQWAYACANLNVIPKHIVIVIETYLDLQSTTHTVIREFCKRMTEDGFVVIDSVNFDICRYCREVIVSEKRVTEHNKRWTGACRRCFSSIKK